MTAPLRLEHRLDPTAPLVVCDDVARTFGSGRAAVVAVHGATCTIDDRARIAIVGPSGCGKSTLLHLIAGLEVPTRGHVHWPQSDTEERGADEPAPAHQIGMVFQSPSLVPTLDVVENVALPMVLAGLTGTAVDDRAEQALASVGVAALAHQLPEELSGGQAQRVAVARVLAQRPRLMIADEPTGQLDRAHGQQLVDVLLATADEIGAALLVSTHDREVADRLGTRWFMHEGRLHTRSPGPAPVPGVLR